MHYANYEHNVNKLLIYFTFYYYMIHEGPDRGKVKLASHTHAALIPPSNYPDIVLGQGTAALEFAEQIEEVTTEKLDAIVLPWGGGRLLDGSAVYFRGSGTKVFDAEPVRGAPRLVQSVRGVEPLEGDFGTLSIADGLRSSVGTQNREILCDLSYLEAMFDKPQEYFLPVSPFMLNQVLQFLLRQSCLTMIFIRGYVTT